MGEDEVPPTAPTMVSLVPPPSTGPPQPPSVVASTPVLAPVEHGNNTGENGLNGEFPIATPSREVMKQYWSKFKRTKPNAALASPAPTFSVESPADEALPSGVLAPASSADPLTAVTVADPANATPAEPALAAPARTEPIPAEPPVPPVPSSPVVSLASSLLPEPETPVPTPHVAMAAALTRATTVDMMPSTPTPATPAPATEAAPPQATTVGPSTPTPATPAPATEAAPSASLSPEEAKAQEVLSSDHMCICTRCVRMWQG